MFLMNGQMIHENSAGKDGLLKIAPLYKKELNPTYYNFCLGNLFLRWSVEDDKWQRGDLSIPGEEVLIIKPNEFLIIQTEERFKCSDQAMGIIGPSTRLNRLGLTLRNSPFIDPNFPAEEMPGYLEFGLKNELPREIRLKHKTVIGKVCFFNISDTYPIGNTRKGQAAKDFERRATEEGPVGL